MNRNQLFLGALLIGAIAIETNLAYSKENGAASPAKRVPSSSQPHAEAKCGRCSGATGVGKIANKATPKNFATAASSKSSDKASPKTFGSTGNGKGLDKASPKNYHSLSTGAAEKSHLDGPGKNDRGDNRQRPKRRPH